MAAVTEKAQTAQQLKEMIERADKLAQEPWPEAWIPSEEEARFVGRFQSWKWMSGQFGRHVPVFVFEEYLTGVSRSVWCYNDMLEKELRNARPRVGEWTLIRYLGKKRNQTGDREYANYRVVMVERPEGESPPWEELDRETVDPRAEMTDYEHDAGATAPPDDDSIPF